MKAFTSAGQTARRSTLAIALFGIVATSPACSVCLDETCELDNNGTGTDAGTDPTAPACTVFRTPHIGLGGEDLAAKNNLVAFADRARAKPYSALLTEYTRVLGVANRPASIDGLGGLSESLPRAGTSSRWQARCS